MTSGHTYATAALKAGIHPKIVSERLGHASVAFTLQTHSHVIKGMDEAAASEIASIYSNRSGERSSRTLGPSARSRNVTVHKSVHKAPLETLLPQEHPSR
jgi:hypothetical protein